LENALPTYYDETRVSNRRNACLFKIRNERSTVKQIKKRISDRSGARHECRRAAADPVTDIRYVRCRRVIPRSIVRGTRCDGAADVHYVHVDRVKHVRRRRTLRGSPFPRPAEPLTAWNCTRNGREPGPRRDRSNGMLPERELTAHRSFIG